MRAAVQALLSSSVVAQIAERLAGEREAAPSPDHEAHQTTTPGEGGEA